MTDGSSMTKACTVAAVLCELLETHMQACDVGGRPSGDHHHHIVSAVHGTRADVEILSSCENEDGVEIGLTLNDGATRSEEHTSELQSLMRISYAVVCLKNKTSTQHDTHLRWNKKNHQ